MAYLEQEAADKHPVVTPTGRDYLAWAKRIVWRDEQGDKSLIHVQVKFAREALGLGEKKAQS